MDYRCIKRTLDIIASASVLLALSPLLLAVAVAIRAESPGSPFFFQTRIGKNLVPFRIVKFRSMVQNAPSLGSWHTQADDPRITRTGRVIRATSLDELPQLWNVLTGDMSLIGPRPNTPQQESQYTPAQWQQRHALRPGITGLAQVNGRSSLTVEQQIAYDLQYVEQHSLALDLRILCKTVAIALNRAGVN
jgi:lipopolysaccharide/colanic/teichoic acid biosynthesis glycosyltransferase